MIYRGYDIVYRPGASSVKVIKDGKTVKEFEPRTKDETIFDWIDAEKRKR